MPGIDAHGSTELVWKFLTDDSNAHLGSFLEICDIIKIHGITEDAIRLRLFPSPRGIKRKHGSNYYHMNLSQLEKGGLRIFSPNFSSFQGGLIEETN